MSLTCLRVACSGGIYDITNGWDCETYEGGIARANLSQNPWLQFQMDAAYSDVYQVWVWPRQDAFFSIEFTNVTVSLGATNAVPGTYVCAEGVTAANATQGPFKLPCAAASGQSVQYVTLQTFRAASSYISIIEVMVLRRGGAARMPAC